MRTATVLETNGLCDAPYRSVLITPMRTDDDALAKHLVGDSPLKRPPPSRANAVASEPSPRNENGIPKASAVFTKATLPAFCPPLRH